MSKLTTFKLNTIVLATSALIAGCGGGGGGGPGTSATLGGLSVTSNYSTPMLVGTIDPLVGVGDGYAITVIKARDINADGVDELVIGGMHSMTFTPATHNHNQMHIFGWNNDASQLTDETNTWFSGGDNIVVGTGPSIKFGNFTGQTGNQLDMFVAGGTDSTILAPNVIFKNNGNNTFTRIDLPGSEGWAHGSDVGDINGDGIDDMVSVGYDIRYATTVLGGATPTVIQNNASGGNSITIAEFLGTGNGVYGLIAMDADVPRLQKYNNISNVWETQTVTIIDNDPTLAVNFPTGRHNIRIQALPVNNDGLQDFVMITRPNAGANGWDASTQTSYVEFYKNLGGGTFEKTALFTKDGAVFMNIEVKDINNDGISDIYLGATGDGSTVLIGKASGNNIVYTEAGSSLISQFEDAIGDTSAWEGGIGSVNIVKGPGGKSYLVGTAKAYNGVNQTEKVYYSEITTSGVVTLDDSVASLQSMWPQLSVSEAQQILSLSGMQFANGVMINLEQARNPIGQLLIPTRNGSFMPLSGSISGVDFNGSTKMLATDAFNRDYGINMGGTVVNGENIWAKKTLAPTVDTSAALSLTNGVATLGDFKLSNSSNMQSAFAYNGFRLSNNFGLQVSIAQLDKNPWINMSGAWGNVLSATLTEVSGVYTNGDFIARGGVVRTVTKFQPGLVTKISPLTAAWADIELAVDDKLTLGGGIFPTVVSGSITAEIPTAVDFTGKVSYTSVSAGIKSPVIGYMRMNYSDKLMNRKDVTYTVSAITSTTRNTSLFANIKIDF